MILSESGESVELWEAPFFEQPPSAEEQLPLAELEAAARAKGMTQEQHNELLAVIGMAAQTNQLVTGMKVPVDDMFKA